MATLNQLDEMPEIERDTEILAAAVAVFADRGVEAARLSDIAREAHLSVAELRRRFGGKEELFRAAVRSVALHHVARACRELPEGSAVDQLRNFCGRGWDLLRTPTFARLYRLSVAEIPRCPDLARFYAEEVYGPVHRALAEIIDRGITAGELRPVSSVAGARLIAAAIVKQAFWCNHADAFGPALGGGCHRAVPDTLSIILGGMTQR
jgi:AcrR family transcriptional regulator